MEQQNECVGFKRIMDVDFLSENDGLVTDFVQELSSGLEVSTLSQ